MNTIEKVSPDITGAHQPLVMSSRLFIFIHVARSVLSNDNQLFMP